VAAQPLILAHDLGTTGNKACLFASDGKLVAAAFVSYPTAYPQPGWAEQDPDDWQRAIFESTRRLLTTAPVSAGQVAAVSFSGHMQGALAVDRHGVPLHPAIIWADQRATSQADWIRQTCGEERVYHLSGNRISPTYTAAKVLWLRENKPDVFRRTHRVLQAKDYAAFLLSGVLASDYSDASLTQLFDLERRAWSTEILGALELSPALLPDLHPSATVIGTVTTAAAAKSGLRAGTPVVIGGGDGACATVGAGSIEEGDVYNYLGSSSWIALTVRRPVLDPRQRTFNFVHLDPRLYCAIGTMQAAGGAYDWLERLLRADTQPQSQHQALDQVVRAVPPGAHGALFLPYLLGERSPHWNPLARGAFVGLSMSDGRAEMARIVLEGVAFNLRTILDSLRGQGIKVDAMRLIGGGASSAVWRQILADIYALPIITVALPSAATAFGAALAGGVGVGLYADYGVVRQLLSTAAAERPNPTTQARYAALYDLFQQTYTALAPIYERLAALPD
jgi:xylulokinase